MSLTAATRSDLEDEQQKFWLDHGKADERHRIMNLIISYGRAAIQDPARARIVLELYDWLVQQEEGTT